MKLLLIIIFLTFLISVLLYILYRMVLWARKGSKGAYVMTMFIPLIAIQAIPPPTYELVEKAKNHRTKKKEYSGDPPNENEDEDEDEI